MTAARIPWEIIETFPSTDADLIDTWATHLDVARTPTDRARALIGSALSSYWAVQEGLTDSTWSEVASQRQDDLDEALHIARSTNSADLVAEALLGILYGTWGPDTHLGRSELVAELSRLRPDVAEEELRLRSIEWEVIQQLDVADLDGVRRTIQVFTDEAAGTELILFTRREVLWRGCLAMLDGDLDESLRINQDAVSSTANVAGAPFSFQNVAITVAIERYLRRGLGDVVDAVRSIRASSPRVAANWDAGLAFALSEIGEVEEATSLFAPLAANRFERVPRDLNWLVTMNLLGLIALTIGAEDEGRVLIDELRPYVHLDGTHGTGYASYGPIGRVVGSLMARWGDPAEAERVFEQVLTTRPAGPWTSLTWLDRAEARRRLQPTRALDDARHADLELGRFALHGWQQQAQILADELVSFGHGGPSALLRSDAARAAGTAGTAAEATWTLQHPTGTATVAASTGLDHLVWLLARPGEPIDVTVLDPLVDGSLPNAAAVETSLDDRARAEYRRRLEVLATIEDPAADHHAEIGFLKRELAGSAHAVSTSAELERLRIRVTKALRRAVDAVAVQSPGLGAHLAQSIETGRTCLYRPPDGLAWSIVRR